MKLGTRMGLDSEQLWNNHEPRGSYHAAFVAPDDVGKILQYNAKFYAKRNLSEAAENLFRSFPDPLSMIEDGARVGIWSSNAMPSIYDFTVRDISGQDVSLETYRGKILLIVNTASKCGFTPQYEGLESLYRDLKDRGLVVLGFPCNQFGGQEPGNAEEIASFCKLSYGVDFPMFAKIDVNGEDASPLFTWLKDQAPGLLGSKAIKWNFTKFLVDREGNAVNRFAPTTTPEEIQPKIEKLI